MSEVLIAIRTAMGLFEGIKEAVEFLQADEEIPASTLRKLQVKGNELDSELDDVIARREAEEG